MKKRGALELSINTIVIVVIGITLLTLGLAFVKNQFGGLTELSEGVFGAAKTEIGKIHGGAKFTAPTQVKLNAGESKQVSIFVANDGSRGNIDLPITLSIGAVGASSAASATCSPTNGVSARIISSPTATLKVGQEATFIVSVAATKDAALFRGDATDPACSITVTTTVGTPPQYVSGGFIIEIQPSTGIF